MEILERKVAFDYLRILASFGVMILHLCAQYWKFINVYSREWQIFNFYDSIVRWTVPVFVMISGALFLNRIISLKTLYLHNIIRLVIAYIVWSFLYSALNGYNFIEHKIMWLTGHYHMWFILVSIGIYISIPILKVLVENKLTTCYFLMISLLVAYVLPSIFLLVKDFGTQWMNNVALVIQDIMSDMNMQIMMGYTSYFVLGYVLSKVHLSKHIRILIYCLGLCGFLSTILLSLLASYKKGEPVSYYGNFTINVLLESIAVFTAFQYLHFNNEGINKLATILSKYSFGAYLVHALIIEKLDTVFKINTLSFYPGLSVPILGFFVFVISYAISAFLHLIPIANKYIV